MGMKINPVKKARMKTGLNMSQLAIIAGVTASRVSQIERGDSASLSGPVLDALATLGYDPGELAREYKQWRQAQVTKMLKWTESRGDGAA